jgi:AraC-like DNA-binding protein
MPLQPDFFRYLASTPEAETWGVVVTGGGRFTAQPRRPYPPSGHPSDHNFSWENGRVLGAFQLVYLAEGRGEMETRANGCVTVVAGAAMLLFPGEWHRYRPAKDTGWVEKWIEIKGPLMDGLLGKAVLSPDLPIITASRRLELEAHIDSIHSLISIEPVGDNSALAAHALAVLSILHSSRGAQGMDRPVSTAVDRAKRIMEDTDSNSLSMPQLARHLGVGYSYFRREFRRRTGISPRQYQLRIRMQRAQRLIGSGDEPLKRVAERLGFSSAYHFSSAFKDEFGVAPSKWRQRKLER